MCGLRFWMRCALPALTAIVAIGCSEKKFEIAPVSGTVMLNEEPLADATVTFVPTSEPGADTAEVGPPSSAQTDGEGHFVLKTRDGKNGAVVGKHKVRITTLVDEGATDNDQMDYRNMREQLPPKYNTKSELTFDVPSDGTEAANFDLTLSRPPSRR
jgi:hypothetical protein